MRHATCPYSSVHLLHLGHILQEVGTTGPRLLRLLRFGDKSCGNPSSLDRIPEYGDDSAAAIAGWDSFVQNFTVTSSSLQARPGP